MRRAHPRPYRVAEAQLQGERRHQGRNVPSPQGVDAKEQRKEMKDWD